MIQIAVFYSQEEEQSALEWEAQSEAEEEKAYYILLEGLYQFNKE